MLHSRSKFLLIIFCCVFGFNHLQAQVAIGTTNTPANPGAMLDVQSTSKGLLFPRMTSDQRRAIVNPAAGLVVYDTEKQALYLFNGMWKAIAVTEGSIPSAASITGIEAPDGVSGDIFGYNVKISGNYAIAGASQDDIGSNPDQGSAYVYKLENGAWTFMQKLVANDGAASDNFGGGLAIDSNYIIVGANNDDIGENVNQGSAYVFKLENGVWIQKQKLTGSNASSGDIFGGYAAIKKGVAVIAASLDDIGTATDAGSAYIFKLNDSTGVWTETQKIYPADGTTGDNFANSIFISGDRMIISAIYDDVNGSNRRGSAYIFTNQNNAWIQTAKIVANDGVSLDYFGTNVAIQGDYAMVGAFGADVSFGNQGACYLYKLETGVWVQKQKVVAADASANGFFGNSIGISNNYIIIGGHGGIGLRGAAYLFQLNTASNTMTQLQKITAADQADNDYFGYFCDISNYNVIIGAYGKNGQKGKVYFKSVD